MKKNREFIFLRYCEFSRQPETEQVGNTNHFFLNETASQGDQLNEEGVKPDKEKTEALPHLKSVTSKSDSFLGAILYVTSFQKAIRGNPSKEPSIERENKRKLDS